MPLSSYTSEQPSNPEVIFRVHMTASNDVRARFKSPEPTQADWKPGQARAANTAHEGFQRRELWARAPAYTDSVLQHMYGV